MNVPFANLFKSVNSWADVRAWLYTILPVLTAALVSNGVLTDNQGTLWAGLVTAVLGPGIAFVMSRDLSSFRAAFYALLTAAQALLIGYGIATGQELDSWMPLISAILGGAAGGAANLNTPTSSPFTQGQQGLEAEKAPVVR
ncbi:holin [Gordonia phage OneUp]|uniref:Holin n=1 Tax=Gordonia phage OneUp TaxID=1838074 RepID=A0A160DEP1_9CAUD|nr:holin [Gordonia phage OneUp]ANA86380.1 holin [Gordonia phage OneUp]